MQFLWPMGLPSFGAISGGGKNQAGLGVLATKVARGADTPPECNVHEMWCPQPQLWIYAGKHCQTNVGPHAEEQTVLEYMKQEY